MTGRGVPDRCLWTVDQLALTGSERVLEFGCGPGVAAELVCQQLISGTMTAIDRSATAVRRTTERCSAFVEAGTLTVEQTTLAELRRPDASYDVAFGINVNVFWTGDGADELAVLRQVLVPGGLLVIAYGRAPDRDSGTRALELVAAHVGHGGFDQIETVTGEAGSAIRALA